MFLYVCVLTSKWYFLDKKLTKMTDYQSKKRRFDDASTSKRGDTISNGLFGALFCDGERMLHVCGINTNSIFRIRCEYIDECGKPTGSYNSYNSDHVTKLVKFYNKKDDDVTLYKQYVKKRRKLRKEYKTTRDKKKLADITSRASCLRSKYRKVINKVEQNNT